MFAPVGPRQPKKGRLCCASSSPSATKTTCLLAIAISCLQQQGLRVEANQTTSSWREPGAAARNVTDPLIYTRHRFDDDYLQIYRRYQKLLTVDEKRGSFLINESIQEDKTKVVEVSYLVNEQVSTSSISQDDLVFEALDRAYLTRLYPYYLFNYDDKRDISRASDRNKVSAKRCDKELDFMMERVGELAQARSAGGSKGLTISSAMNPEVLAMFDAFGIEETGLLVGNYHWVGNWRQCAKGRIFHKDNSNLSNSVNFRARYCVASLRSKRWDGIAQARARELEAQHHFQYDQQKYDYARFHRIQLGICIPESCDTRLFERRPLALHQLATFKLSEPFRSYDLADFYCLPDETSELRQLEPSGWVFLAFVGVWLFAMLVATICDYRSTNSISASGGSATIAAKSSGSGGGSLACTTAAPNRLKSAREKLIDSLSLLRSFDRLTETKSCQPPPPTPTVDDKKVRSLTERNKLVPNDLLFLNCIKVLTNPIIITGHVGMIYKHLDRNVLDYDCLSKGLANFHFSAVFFVDWYFVITGFLTTYLMFVTHRVERNNLRAWVGAVVHRYWRLAPLYLLTFWFCQSIFMYTNQGPLWDYGSSNMTLRSICRRESFIVPLTLTSNLHPIHKECIMPSWYISNDFQFFLITPFILVLLHKSPMFGWLASLGTIVACLALRLHRYLTDPRAKPLDLMRPRYDLYMRNNWDMYPTYVFPHYRVASYLIGLLAGHYTYMVLSGQWSSPLYFDRMNAALNSEKRAPQREAVAAERRKKLLLRSLAWSMSALLSLTMMLSTLIISVVFPDFLEPQTKYITALVYSLDHSITSVAIGLLLTTMMFGQFSAVKRWMSQPFWSVLARLSFINYLVQIELINWVGQSADRPLDLSDVEMVKGVLYISGILYPLSTILVLIFEIPLAQLERQFIAPFYAMSPSLQPVVAPKSPAPARKNSALTSGGKQAQLTAFEVASEGESAQSALLPRGPARTSS